MTDNSLRKVITNAVRETARITVQDTWEGAYTSFNQTQLVEAIIAALAAMPMRCDCTKRFEDWSLSDQLISKARETVPPPQVDSGREEIAALLYAKRFPHRTWLSASLAETALSYEQADAILALRPERSAI